MVRIPFHVTGYENSESEHDVGAVYKVSRKVGNAVPCAGVGNAEVPAPVARKNTAVETGGRSGGPEARPAACAKPPDTPCVGECVVGCNVAGLCITSHQSLFVSQSQVSCRGQAEGWRTGGSQGKACCEEWGWRCAGGPANGPRNLLAVDPALRADGAAWRGSGRSVVLLVLLCEGWMHVLG